MGVYFCSADEIYELLSFHSSGILSASPSFFECFVFSFSQLASFPELYMRFMLDLNLKVALLIIKE